MNPTQAADILELAASVWPLRVTDRARESWFLALARTDFYDAKEAIGVLARDRKTVHVSDVVKAAERVRASLLRSLPPAPEPPDELADDPRLFIEWRKTARERQLDRLRLERHSVPA